MKHIECPKCYDKIRDKIIWKSMLNHRKILNLRCQNCLHQWSYELHMPIEVEKNNSLICF